MKALSLWQPWASLLVAGIKRVETRSWEMRHRGPLLIHAAKKWDGTLAELCLKLPFRDALKPFGVPGQPHNWTVKDLEAKRSGWSMPFGAIIGKVHVAECYRTEDVDFDRSGLDVIPDHPVWQYAPGKLRLWHEQEPFGDYSPGRFAFLCDTLVAFTKPIPYRGAQGMFDVPDELIREAA